MANGNAQQPTQLDAMMALLHTLTNDMGAVRNDVGNMRQEYGERLGRLEQPPIRRGPIRIPPIQPRQQQQQPQQQLPEEEENVEDDEMEDELGDPLGAQHRRMDPLLRHQQRGAAPRETNHDLKITPPSFAGKSDPESYIDWERSMEKIFDCYQYGEGKKVDVAAAQLTGNALAWWDRTIAERRRLRFMAVSTWANMKILLRARYVPEHYQRDLQKRFRKLMQGQRSVEEYYLEFEKLMNLLELEDSEEAMMAQFIDGLQERIQRKVELMRYNTLVELYHLAVKIESQNKRKASLTRRNPNPNPNPTWQASSSRPQDKGKAVEVESRFKSKPVEAPKTFRADQGKSTNTSSRSRDIVCFKCQGRGHISCDFPNNRVMILTQEGG